MSETDERLKDEGSRLQVVAAGATAGLISRFVVAPLDVVKIRMQLRSTGTTTTTTLASSSSTALPYTSYGAYATVRDIVTNEGLTALWKGNVPAELMYVAYAAVQFTTYRSVTMLLHRIQGTHQRLPHAAESFVSGATAGAVATATTYPLDLLRTRFAAQGNERVYASLRGAVRAIRRDEGARGFFRGLSPALAQIVPFMGIFFAAYESARRPLAGLQLPWGTGDATAGVAASVLAKSSVFPLDLVRKRIQVQGPTRSRYVYKNIPEYVGTLSTVRRILAAEGIRGLYRGLPVSLLKAAPASAVTMWTYERVLKFLVGMGEERGGG
ncbi:mitochondrial thiamine pyrophosphate transporter [Parahypoxylon ruwenzoriense]